MLLNPIEPAVGVRGDRQGPLFPPVGGEGGFEWGRTQALPTSALNEDLIVERHELTLGF